MKPSRWLVVALFLVSAPVGRADAQLLSRLPLAFQARAGVAVPTGTFADPSPGIGAEPGLALELGGLLEATSWLGVYAGYQRSRFGCEGCRAVNADAGVTTTGASAGVQLRSPLARFGVRPWARGGAVRQTLEFRRDDSGIRSEPGTGFGLGGGVEVEVLGVRIAPGVHFQSYPVDVQFAGYPTRSLDVSHLTVDLGLVLPF